MQTRPHEALIQDIEAFLTETGMGAHYFGRQAGTGTEVVKRLRNGGRIWPETEAKLRAFMRTYEKGAA